MTRKKRRMQLLTAEEVKELAPRIDEMLDGCSYYSPRQDTLAVHGSHALFAAWAASAAQCGDTSQLRRIVDRLQSLDWEDEFGSIATQAAIRLAGDDPRLRAQVHRLAGAESYSIVHPLVAWLDPGRPAERKLLERLCQHRSRYIVKEARNRLASTETLPWWVGYFEHDPTVGLDEAETSALQPKFARYIELLDDHRNEHADEILSLVRQMPPRAKAGACLQLLRHWGWRLQIGPVLGELLSVEGGARMICDFVKSQEHEFLGFEVSEGLRNLPSTTTSEQRAAVAREAMSRLRDASWKDIDDVQGLPSTYAHMITLTWPEDLDPTPVLDFLRERADPDAQEPAPGLGYWDSMVKRLKPRWLPLLKEHFKQALAGDFVGRFSILGPSLESVADQFPEAERHQMALDVLDRKDAKGAVEWAVKTLAAIAPEEVDQRLDDPRVRKHAFSLKAPGPFIRGRRELRAGTLTPSEVGTIANHVGEIFGGQVNLLARLRDGLPGLGDPSVKNAPLREAIVAAAPDLAGPLTEEEWALIRRLRAELSPSQVDEAGLEFVIPEGPWHPDDLAWLEKLVNEIVPSKPQFIYFAAVLCAQHPCPEVLPLLEKLEEITPPDNLFDDRTPMLADEVRQALGLPTKHGDGDEVGGDTLDPDGTDDDW